MGSVFKTMAGVFGLEIKERSPDQVENPALGPFLALMIGFTVCHYGYHGIFRPFFTEKIDFEAYYNAAVAFRYGIPIYDPMVRFFQEGPLRYQGPLPYVYPPTFVIFLSPFAYMTFKSGAIVWLFLNQILFLAGMLILLKTLSRRYSRTELVALGFTCLNFTPLFVEHLVGQCNIPLFFLMVMAIFMLQRGKPVYAGVALGIACLIKVIPGLVLAYLLWKQQYRAFLSGIAAIAVLLLYSFIFFDPEAFLWYFRTMINQDVFGAFHDNHALAGFISRALTHSIWVKGLVNAPHACRLSIAVGSIAILGAFMYATRKKCDPQGSRFLHEYALSIITMLLLSRMTSTPYLVMLLLPLGVLVKDWLENGIPPSWRIPLAGAYGVMATWSPLAAGKFLDMSAYEYLLSGWPAMVFSVQFFGLFLFWIYFLFHLPVGAGPSSGVQGLDRDSKGTGVILDG